VLGVRLGGLKSVKFGLQQPQTADRRPQALQPVACVVCVISVGSYVMWGGGGCGIWDVGWRGIEFVVRGSYAGCLARLTHRAGAPSRRCPRVDTPAPGRCSQLGLHRRGQVVPRSRPWKQAAEAKPSSRRCAGRKAGAHRRDEEPRQESLPGSAGRECTAFTSAIRAD
jgi:hypothetical protein